MARPLRVLTFLSRLVGLSAVPPVSVNGCRFASRGGGGAARMVQSHRSPRHGDDMSEDELGLEDGDEVEGKLQALVDEGRKRRKTVKYQILRRQMTPPGAPGRKLTWDAIEQIRYLKQEQPDEWTVERLAEGYSVTPDVILRVLRSKFVPAPDRKVKQDAKVMVGLGQQALPSGAGTVQDRLKLPGNSTQTALPPGSRALPPGSRALPPGSRDGSVVPVDDSLVSDALMHRGEDSASLSKRPAPIALLPTQFSRDVPVTRSKEENSASNKSPTADKEDEESWDGRLLTDEELEEFMEMEKPYPVVQVGNDFFDAEGNFLYRI